MADGIENDINLSWLLLQSFLGLLLFGTILLNSLQLQDVVVSQLGKFKMEVTIFNVLSTDSAKPLSLPPLSKEMTLLESNKTQEAILNASFPSYS